MSFDKEVLSGDYEVLKGLGRKLAECAADPVNETRKKEWQRMNNLQPGRPMIWITEEPWHEIDVEGKLKNVCENPFCRQIEDGLRKTLYEWEYLQGDMIIDPVIYCPLAIDDPGVGIDEDVDIVKTDEENRIVSRHFNIQIKDEGDLEKIQFTTVIHNTEETEWRYGLLTDIFNGILPVQKRGFPGFWFAPWDDLVRFTGIQEALMDLIMRPELIRKAMDRMMNAHLHRLDQFEELNLLALNNNNTRVVSGAYGYVDELPGNDYNPAHVKTANMWGGSTAQIFSEVSPQMHEEFALEYENRWMERFGLNYYGCCEPLHKKIDILRKIPRLRKISMSPWVDLDEASEKMGRDFVFSYKPSPAVFTRTHWDAEKVKNELKTNLQKLENNVVEIIMKDISTVQYEPERLWEWARIVKEVTDELYS